MTNTSSSAARPRVAVFFGGRSPEHDVSIVSGLQALEAIDTRQFDPFPVYVSPRGEWFVGEALRAKSNYMLSEATRAKLTQVTLDMTAHGQGGRLLPLKSGLFGPAKAIAFDIALPAFHGLIGEDGGFQGLLDAANIPYTGMRTKASAVFMDKVTTKHALATTGVPQLPFAAISRPQSGLMVDKAALDATLKTVGYPCCIKPAHLGSSIGVGKANNVDEARAILANLFQYDTKALAEPFVQNLTEYNIAVRMGRDGKVLTSAIERPKTSAELLDFKEKYISGGGTKGGKKAPSQSSEGMLSLTRDINPDLPAEMEANIRKWAEAVFAQLDGSGGPRIDFICNGKTGEVWFNELNPCPGSFGFFLWSAAKTQPVLFSELLSDLLHEALELNAREQLPDDPTPVDARLFRR